MQVDQRLSQAGPNNGTSLKKSKEISRCQVPSLSKLVREVLGGRDAENGFSGNRGDVDQERVKQDRVIAFVPRLKRDAKRGMAEGAILGLKVDY